MKWWGPAWPSEDLRAVVCEDDELRTPTPVGETCPWCQEPICEGESGVWMPHWENKDIVEHPWHQECSFRSIMGSRAHQEGKCSCVDGAGDEPEYGMTRREEAAWVTQFYVSRGMTP